MCCIVFSFEEYAWVQYYTWPRKPNSELDIDKFVRQLQYNNTNKYVDIGCHGYL